VACGDPTETLRLFRFFGLVVTDIVSSGVEAVVNLTRELRRSASMLGDAGSYGGRSADIEDMGLRPSIADPPKKTDEAF
jgi:hypothetical protein